MALTEFKISIYNKLITIADRVYSEKAENNAVFPYCVYKLPNSQALDAREDFTLTVDIWDNLADTSRLETLTNNVANALNYYIHNDGYSSWHAYKEGQSEIPDPDETIHRRQIRYTMKSYFR